jgi:hypothetical protein
MWQGENRLEKSWLCTTNCCSVWVHRTVWWCTGQCLVRQTSPRWTDRSRDSTAVYDYNSLDCPVSRPRRSRRSREKFNDVRLNFTGLSGEPTVDCATVGSEIGGRHVACTNGRKGAPDSVRCANRRWSATVVYARKGRRSALDRLQWLSGGAPDCTVRHLTEGKISLPRLSPTAPSCLGAIKGTPRRMEELPKLTRKILRLQDSILTHSILWDSDLSSIWVENSLCCVLSSSCDLCAWLCSRFESCVCCSPLPYFRASLWSSIVRARGSKLWRFLANGRKSKKEEHHGIQVDHWITWKGLSATFVHWDATTWK